MGWSALLGYTSIGVMSSEPPWYVHVQTKSQRHPRTDMLVYRKYPEFYRDVQGSTEINRVLVTTHAVNGACSYVAAYLNTTNHSEG